MYVAVVLICSFLLLTSRIKSGVRHFKVGGRGVDLADKKPNPQLGVND